MKIINLASSSSANCTILNIGGMNFIVDTGKIDCDRIKNEMNKNDISSIDAILITHSHVDHLSKNTFAVSKQLNTPIFIRKETFDAAKQKRLEKKINEHPKDLIKTYSDLQIIFNNVSVQAIDVSHRGMGRDNSGLSVAYYFESKNGNNENILYATDVGSVSEDLQSYITKSDVLFIEANHCPEKVNNSPRHYKHKKWLLSERGHLSNEQTASAILNGIKIRNKPYKSIILSHLSRKCNSDNLAFDTVYSKIKDYNQSADSVTVLPAKEGKTILVEF